MHSPPPLHAPRDARQTRSESFIKCAPRPILITTPKGAQTKSRALIHIRHLPGVLQLLEEHQVGIIRSQHEQVYPLQHAAPLHMRLLDLAPAAIGVLLQCPYPQVLLHDDLPLSFPCGESTLVSCSLFRILLSKRKSTSRFHSISPQNRREYRQARGFSGMLCLNGCAKEHGVA